MNSDFPYQSNQALSNTYFQFKQFRINQEHCAMKVCTDACVFGAWVAEKLSSVSQNSTNILDIGAGTGLLSLMLAQQVSGEIEAVEIDELAFEQCESNFSDSPFSEKLKAHQSDIQGFAKESEKQFELIISNPPFFANGLKTAQSNKNKARHDTSLTIKELLDSAKTLLSENGSFFVLLPFYENTLLLELAEKLGLRECRRLEIFNQESKPIFRVVSELRFTEKQANFATEKLIIRDEYGEYSARFVELLKAYYLYL
ncbi:MAG: tRNA1Val (adenine37-N6)-methyltransferase [Bacteroidia bacterium]